jgi:hypothetical protein
MSGVRLVTLIMGAIAFVVGVVYLGPSELVRRPLPPNQTSIVVWVESIGPLWPTIFALTGVVLCVAAVFGRGTVAAHVGGIFTWVLFGGAILVGALKSEPPSPIVTGLLAVGIGAIHFGMTFVREEVSE